MTYLEGAAERGMGRLDWRNAFLGVTMTLLVESIVPPETVRSLLSLTLGVLGHLFGLSPPELIA